MTKDYLERLLKLGYQPMNSRAMDEQGIETVERKLGVSLPEDYRQFLLQCPTLLSDDVTVHFSTEHRLSSTLVFSLYSWEPNHDRADSYFSVISNLEGDEDFGLEGYPGLALVRDTDEPGWPKELLPIGNDPGGNMFCMAISGLRPGAIFFHRANLWDGDQNVYLIADSFDEFVNLLRPM